MTRSEAGALTFTELQCVADRLRAQLRAAWDRGEPGSVTALYDLALVTSEAQVVGVPLTPLAPRGQLTLDDEVAALVSSLKTPR